MKYVTLIALPVISILLCSCFSENSLFSNAETFTMNGKSYPIPQEQIIFRQEMHRLYMTWFTDEEIAVLCKIKKDPKLLEIRKQIVNNYSEEQRKLYFETLKSIIGIDLYEKIMSNDFRKEQINLWKQYNNRLSEKIKYEIKRCK